MSEDMRQLIKLIESVESNEVIVEGDGSEAFSYGASRERFTAHEYEQMHSMIKDAGDLASSELSQIAKENAVDWPRGYQSLRLALIRLYVLITGDLPDGMTPAPDWYNNVSNEMINFAESKGYDVDTNLVDAIELAKARRAEQEKKISREKAKEKMVAYWSNMKDKFNKWQRRKLHASREKIINSLMQGIAVEDAFKNVINESRYIKEEVEYEGVYTIDNYEKIIKPKLKEAHDYLLEEATSDNLDSVVDVYLDIDQYDKLSGDLKYTIHYYAIPYSDDEAEEDYVLVREGDKEVTDLYGKLDEAVEELIASDGFDAFNVGGEY